MRLVMPKLFGVLLLAGSAVAGWMWFDYQAFAKTPLDLDGAFELTITPGTPLVRVARELEQRGILSSADRLRLMARLSGSASRIKAGRYRLQPGTTPSDLLTLLVEGRVVQHTLTLIEGWDFRQVLAAVHAHPQLVHTLSDANHEGIMAQLGYPNEHPEGLFYPDTYQFPDGTTDVAFLRRAYEAMKLRLDFEWSQRAPDLPLQTAYEALILASIVEKETGQESERAQIAGVFVRRLLKGMRLQTDPTVIYGLGVSFDGNLRRRDLLADNPYNTYRIKGLPPTPIAMPGGDAIHAALHPAPGNTLYFVSRGDGSHYFSATLEEHNAAVVKYQLKGQPRPFSSSQ